VISTWEASYLFAGPNGIGFCLSFQTKCSDEPKAVVEEIELLKNLSWFNNLFVFSLGSQLAYVAQNFSVEKCGN